MLTALISIFLGLAGPACEADQPAGQVQAACSLAPCATGRVAVDGGLHCCWPGQRWSSRAKACQGTPRCPEPTLAHAGRCLALDTEARLHKLACLRHKDAQACDRLADLLAGAGFVLQATANGLTLGTGQSGQVGTKPTPRLQPGAPTRTTAVSPGAALAMRKRACKLGLRSACDWLAAEARNEALTGLTPKQWYARVTKRCRAGNRADCRDAAEALASGQGVDADPEQASAAMARACRRGDAEACSLLVSGVSGLRLADEARIPTLEAACKRKVGLACESLAGEVEDQATCDRLLARACGLGRKEACEHTVRQALLAGEVDRRLAVRACAAGAKLGCQVLWDQACTAGDPQACAQFDSQNKAAWRPRIEVQLKPATQSTQRAVVWLRAAARQCVQRHAPRLRPARFVFEAVVEPDVVHIEGKIPPAMKSCLERRLLKGQKAVDPEARPLAFGVQFEIQG